MTGRAYDLFSGVYFCIGCSKLKSLSETVTLSGQESVGVKARIIGTATSKWVKTQLLLRDSYISRYIPDTRKFNSRNLERMMYDYGMVYVKPERGTYGKGVIRAKRGDNQSFIYQQNEKVRSFSTFNAFYTSLSKRTHGKSYLIQKGIHLLKHKKRRFDIRVMVQLSPKGVWEATGVIGRLGHPRKIVTNYHSGGKPMAIDRLLSSNLTESQQIKLIQELHELGIRIARHFQKMYPKITKIGVDIGLDRRLIPWIIEVNMNPDPYIFNQLKDKAMYKKVMRYRRFYLKK